MSVIIFLLYTYLVYSNIAEHRSLTAAVIPLAHVPEFVTALELSIESKPESASDLEHCIAQVKYVTLFYQPIFFNNFKMTAQVEMCFKNVTQQFQLINLQEPI